MPDNFEGQPRPQVALVTGASRGIGAATACALARQGVHVIITARTQSALEAVEETIHQAGGTATIAPLDLRDGAAIDALGGVIAQRWGYLDVLVLNAAQLGDITPLTHVEPAQFDSIIATNVTASYRLLRALDPLLRAAPRARVVGVTSGVARQPRAYWGAYGASKAALETMVLAYGEEVSGLSPVRVALYNPGRTRTRMRMEAYPGENPETLPLPAEKASEIIALLGT